MVPNDDWVCRFVRYDDWNFQEGRPAHTAFSASNRQLSVFHVERVERGSAQLQDLCINSLSGAGEAHLLVEEFTLATEATNSPVFDPKVYWRPEFVSSDWVQWADAHAQVESEQGPKSFPQTYRVALALSASHLRPPTRQNT